MLFLKLLFSISLTKVPLSNQKANKSDLGLTLLELLISGIIVGILSILATPAYIATIDKFHYGEAKLQMGCIKRELEAFRMEKGYFPEDIRRNNAPTDRNKVPAGIDCFLKSNTDLTPYNSTYDYENWSVGDACVIKIIFFGKDREKQSNDTRDLHQQPGFYNDRERKDSSDDLILSLGLQPPEVCD